MRLSTQPQCKTGNESEEVSSEESVDRSTEVVRITPLSPNDNRHETKNHDAHCTLRGVCVSKSDSASTGPANTVANRHRESQPEGERCREVRGELSALDQNLGPGSPLSAPHCPLHSPFKGKDLLGIF